ncbi:MAG: polysaccharide deacetylase family protein [SAR324 cluster bacterium]
MPAIVMTVDVEDPLQRYDANGRYVENTRRILAFLRERKVRGTFFVVGRAGEAVPWLVREIVGAGHEVACHSYRHVPLHRETPATFRAETARAKEALEQAGGVPVAGYRAPVFSLTARTTWAVDELAGLGFRYSSSILPARNPLHGFPGAPQTPFRWQNGLVEFPVPVVQAGPIGIPYLGGIYLRYLPAWLVLRWARARGADVLWTYLHPYDVDAGEPYARMPDTAAWMSWLLWLNRKGTWAKLAKVLELGPGRPLGELTADRAWADGLPRILLPVAST